MKAKTLIKALSELDPEQEIYIPSGGWSFYPVEKVRALFLGEKTSPWGKSWKELEDYELEDYADDPEEAYFKGEPFKAFTLE